MKVRKHHVVLALGVLLLSVAAVLSWRQYRESTEHRTQASAANGSLTQRDTERRASVERSRDADEQAIPLEHHLPDAGQPQVLDRAGRPSDGKEAEQWLAAANDPDLLRRIYGQVRRRVERRYDPLFKQLGLTPGQIDQVLKLLVDKRQAPVDIIVAGMQNDGDPRRDYGAFIDQVQSARAGIEDQIKSLLGDANYALYREYDQMVGQSNTVTRLQQALQTSGNPLTDEQVNRLQQLLQVNGSGHISADVVWTARAFLTPPQQQALQALREEQLAASVRRQQRALPSPPPPSPQRVSDGK